MTTTGPVRCAIWARVSTAEQHAANQLAALRKVAADKGYVIAAEYVTEDSAWGRGSGTNGKGAKFDQARAELRQGAHQGAYSVVLVWALDRLSRRGYSDLSALLAGLRDDGCEVWSQQEPWLHSVGPFGEIVVHMLAWIAQQESQRRSERTKAGIERRRAAGLPVGRQPGSADKARRKRAGYISRHEEMTEAERAEHGRLISEGRRRQLDLDRQRAAEERSRSAAGDLDA
jgi:DNA invertase Pin-like site-specific DNA recombinase